MRDKRQGKSPSTQAGAFIHEEIHHIREGKHGARSTQQAIAIGLSKARRAGVALKPPVPGRASKETRERAEHDYEEGQSHPRRKPSSKRAAATKRALRREGHGATSRPALSQHAKSSARKRTASQRSASARKAARTRARTSRS
jgi:hypothetical protein